jgi:RecBCD enzyme subunit RecD, N-terminal domain
VNGGPDPGAAAMAERDVFDPRLAIGASGLLRQFNQAGVLQAADVHVARALGRLAGEADESVLLAAALAVRGLRLGHVLVPLERIAGTAAVDADEQVDLSTLPWPEPEQWLGQVVSSRGRCGSRAPRFISIAATQRRPRWRLRCGLWPERARMTSQRRCSATASRACSAPSVTTGRRSPHGPPPPGS